MTSPHDPIGKEPSGDSTVTEYLLGEWDQPRRDEFERRIASDPALAADVDRTRRCIDDLVAHYQSESRLRLESTRRDAIFAAAADAALSNPQGDENAVTLGDSRSKPYLAWFTQRWVLAASLLLATTAGLWLTATSQPDTAEVAMRAKSEVTESPAAASPREPFALEPLDRERGIGEIQPTRPLPATRSQREQSTFRSEAPLIEAPPMQAPSGAADDALAMGDSIARRAFEPTSRAVDEAPVTDLRRDAQEVNVTIVRSPVDESERFILISIPASSDASDRLVTNRSPRWIRVQLGGDGTYRWNGTADEMQLVEGHTRWHQGMDPNTVETDTGSVLLQWRRPVASSELKEDSDEIAIEIETRDGPSDASGGSRVQVSAFAQEFSSASTSQRVAIAVAIERQRSNQSPNGRLATVDWAALLSQSEFEQFQQRIGEPKPRR